MGDLETAMQAADAATEQMLSADTVVGVAQTSSSPGDAATNAQAVAHLQASTQQVDSLRQQTSSVQRRIWGSLPKDEQDAYTSAGYKPPKGGSHGLFGGLIHDVEALPGEIWQGTVHNAEQALNTLKPVQTFMRGFRYEEELHQTSSPEEEHKGILSQNSLFDPGAWSVLAHPSEWAAGYRAVSNGEKTFSPALDQEYVKQYGVQKTDLAKKVASGMAVNDIVAKIPADPNKTDADGFTQRAATLRMMQSDPEFGDLVAKYRNAKLSFGRELVGADYMNKNPQRGMFLSGLADATVDYYVDPTGAALKGAHAYQEAQYLVRTPDQITNAYNASSAVRAYMASVARDVKAGSQTAFLRNHPNLRGPIQADLFARGADTPEKVNNYFADQVGFQRLFNGRSAARDIPNGAVVVPHLGLGRQAVAAIRQPIDIAAQAHPDSALIQLADHPIDFLAEARGRAALRDVNAPLTRLTQAKPWQVDVGGTLIGGATPSAHPFLNAALHPWATGESAIGRSLKFLVTLDPTMKGDVFNSADEREALRNLKNYASGFLPRADVDRLGDAFATAGGTGKDFDIWRGLVDSVGKAAGVEMTQDGKDWWARQMDDVTTGFARQKYSFGDNDQWMEGGRPTSVGLLKQDQSAMWSMPSVRDIMAQSRKMSITRDVMGSLPMQMIDHLMPVWRILTLIPSLAFGTRMVISEWMAGALRDGALNMAQARLAGTALGADADPVSKFVEMMTRHLPDRVAISIRDHTDLATHLIASSASRALGHIPGVLPYEEFQKTAEMLGRRGITDSYVADHLSAVNNTSQIISNEPFKIARDMINGRATPMEIIPTGNYSTAKVGDKLYTSKYMGQLDRLAKDDWGRIALANDTLPMDQRVAEVADALMADPYWKHSKRFLGLPDGARVAAGQVSLRQAAEDHARRIVNDADWLTHTPRGDSLITGTHPETGEPMRLTQYLHSTGHAPSSAALNEIPLDQLPEEVHGQDILYRPLSLFRHLTNMGFNGLVGRPLDFFVRHPMFWLNATNARRDIEAEGGIGMQMLEGARRDALAEHEAAVALAQGKNVYYHATTNPNPLGPVNWDAGIFNSDGPGLYVTDSPEVAGMGRPMGEPLSTSGRQPTVHRWVWKGAKPPKLINLDAPELPLDTLGMVGPEGASAFAPEVTGTGVPDVFQVAAGKTLEIANQVGYDLRPLDLTDDLSSIQRDMVAAMPDELGQLAMIFEMAYARSGADYWDAFRRKVFEATAGLPQGAAADVEKEVADHLQRLGYDGLTRADFSLEGPAVHQLSVFWDPSKLAQHVVPGPAEMATRLRRVNARVKDQIADQVMKRAVDTTIPMIHDPQLRSYASVITRNIFPFFYAQQQAFQRYARVFMANPRAIRTFMLMNQGIAHSGFVHTDPQSGKKYFIYPGSAFADKQLAGLLQHIGIDVQLPISTGLQGDPNFINPLRSGLTPNTGPAVGVPLTFLTDHFPELQPVKQSLMPNAGGTQYLRQVVPNNLYKVLDALAPNFINNAQYNSAYLDTIRTAAAVGQLPDQNDPAALQQFMTRTKNYTRIRILMRAILGLTTPSSPQFTVDDLDEKLQELFKSLSPEEALAVYQKEYPDATPHTVYQSRSVSGAPLPDTKAALSWMQDNRDIIARYPMAAGYLLPQNPGPTDQNAYNEQLLNGLRIRKTPKEFIDDLYYAEGARDYFPLEKYKNQLLAKTHSNTAKQNIRNEWTRYSKEYMLGHPIFAQILQGGPDGLGPGGLTRTQVQTQLADALNNDPVLAANPMYGNLRALVNAYDTFNSTAATLNNRKKVTLAARAALGENFAATVISFVHNHPETQAYYDRVIRPAMTPALTALGVAS